MVAFLKLCLHISILISTKYLDSPHPVLSAAVAARRRQTVPRPDSAQLSAGWTSREHLPHPMGSWEGGHGNMKIHTMTEMRALQARELTSASKTFLDTDPECREAWQHQRLNTMTFWLSQQPSHGGKLQPNSPESLWSFTHLWTVQPRLPSVWQVLSRRTAS